MRWVYDAGENARQVTAEASGTAAFLHLASEDSTELMQRRAGSLSALADEDAHRHAAAMHSGTL